MIELHSADKVARPAVLALSIASGAGGPDAWRRVADDLDRLGLAPNVHAAVTAFLATAPPPAPGTVTELPLPTMSPELILFCGLAADTPAGLRAAGAAITRHARCAELTVVPPAGAESEVAAFLEGLVLGGYRFSVATAPMAPTAPTAPAPELKSVEVWGSDPGAVERARSAAAALWWARELANTRSSVKTPQWLADQARRYLTPFGVRVVERDVDWLTAHGFGGILAVGGGSSAPPRLVEATWRPRGAPTDPHVVLVGKSITFDSGGLNIKPLDSMTTMYTDMAGGAAVLAALRLVAERKIPIRVTALLPAAENSVSGSAMRPSDVIRHYGGRTSEIGNTDAEGRLVLADAMAYAVARLRPSVLVDLATLTGAIKVALGVRTGGLFASSDDLAAGLLAAGDAVGEAMWRLPLADDYLSALDSDIADATNSPGNPGAITAALFLRPFAGGLPWAHLDIAGPARAGADDGDLSIGATGFGARLLAHWIEHLR